MQLLVYLLIYPLLWLISILPFRWLYAFSDFVYLIVYRLIGYRKKTVRTNLNMTLPHLSEKERRLVEKKFYHHMCDMFLEMIKTMSISQKEMEKRFAFTNLEVYKDLEKKGKSIAIITAHYATYEWIISINKYIDFEGYAIYKKIRNPHFDKLVKNIRSRFKAFLIDTKETPATIERNRRENRLSVYGFASDQSPKADKAHHWQKFMGITVPVHTGAEMLSKKYDMNVILLQVEKIKRGHYEATFERIFENVNSIPNYQITDYFLQKLEEQILNKPEFYLWTHKRWKHKKC
ncbi:MAG TPA: lysophospholipid acyltransferase family protein [Flavobacteriaceae bacterium]|nr:lysophospholipid acyltransferase family protein [Flavobacteriaceae bacterium]